MIYVPLYFVKVLYLTGIVYVLFLSMCLLGLRAWRREIATSTGIAAAPDLVAAA